MKKYALMVVFILGALVLGIYLFFNNLKDSTTPRELPVTIVEPDNSSDENDTNDTSNSNGHRHDLVYGNSVFLGDGLHIAKCEECGEAFTAKHIYVLDKTTNEYYCACGKKRE